MNETKKKIVKICISAVLCLICAFSLTLLGISLGLSRPLSPEGILRSAQRCHYPEEMKVKIKEDFEGLCETSGIPLSLAAEFLEEAVSEEEMLSPIRAAVGLENQQIPSQEWEAALALRIEEYAVSLRDKGEMFISEEEWEEMKAGFPQLSAFFIHEITSSINLNGIYSVFGEAVLFVRALLPYLLVGAPILFFVAGGMLFGIWKKQILFFPYPVFGCAGLLLAVPALWVTGKNYVMRLGINPRYLRLFLNEIAGGVCGEMILIGGIFLLIALGCGISYAICFGKKKSKGKEE